jgi:glycolate oxidase FAD binding subunit
MIETRSIREELAAIVGPTNVRPAAPDDAVCGRVPQLIVEPETEQQLAAALSCANNAGLAVIPRGGGTKMQWGNPPRRADLILSTLHLNRILEHVWADLTVTVEAGCTLQSLQSTLAKHGQRLAFDGLWPERATLGGVLSTNDSGALRIRFGSLRDLVIGATIALPDGTLASSGGKVVKNVAGYDLPKLATGALGTLGVITRAVFRLHPLPKLATTLTCRSDRIETARRLFVQILDSKLAYSSLQARFPDSREPQLFVDVLFEGTQQGIAAQIEHLQSLASPLKFSESDNSVWRARQDLFAQSAQGDAASTVLKISVPPADAITVMGSLTSLTATRMKFSAVVQGTGIGMIRLAGEKQEVRSIAGSFRKATEHTSGSLVTLDHTLPGDGFDAWGTPGDALPLMRAVKNRLDPKNTLNQGRFVGGI